MLQHRCGKVPISYNAKPPLWGRRFQQLNLGVSGPGRKTISKRNMPFSCVLFKSSVGAASPHSFNQGGHEVSNRNNRLSNFEALVRELSGEDAAAARQQQTAGIDFAEADRFLELLDPVALIWTFQVFDDSKRPGGPAAQILHGSFRELRDKLAKLNFKGCGIYVTVNETDGRGRKSENTKRVRTVFQEDDSGFAGDFPLIPSLVVESSPGKFHRYWLLSNAWPADEQGRIAFTGVMEQLIAGYGSDPSAKDVSRVLRLPGFMHVKNPKRPFRVRIVAASGKRYTRAQLLEAFPLANPERKRPKILFSCPAYIEEFKSALAAVPPDTSEDYGSWLDVGMAAKYEFGQQGLPIWDEWSQRASTYDRAELGAKWISFKGSGITARTVYDIARKAGWLGWKADPRDEFDPIEELAGSKASEEPPQTQGVVLEVLDKISPKDIAWEWRDVLARGKLTLLAGPIKQGKSQVLVSAAAIISTGGKWPVSGETATRGTVLILQCEDGVEDTVVPRLIAAGADRTKIKRIKSTMAPVKGGKLKERHFSLADDLALLGAKIKELGDVVALGIDPVTAYMGKIDSNDTAQVRSVLDPIAAFAAEHHVAVLGITHLNKGSGDAVKRVIGSQAFTAVVRTNFMVVKDKANAGRRLMLPTGSNISAGDKGFAFNFATSFVDGLREKVSFIQWEDDYVCDNADEALQEAEAPEARHGREGAIEFLREELKEGPLAYTELEKRAKGAGISTMTLRRAKRDAVVKSEKVGDKWMWRL
jgi:hypothetical protein